MDDQRARGLLAAERTHLIELLNTTEEAAGSDRAEEDVPGEMSDPAERLVAEGTDDAVAASLRQRLAAIDRAQQRLDDGTYGRSVRSGATIPDDRLEADPAAELTVEEAGEEQGISPR